VGTKPDVAEFCREIETYLCRKNDGHLIRVTGPSFDLVSGWAEQGVPKQPRRGVEVDGSPVCRPTQGEAREVGLALGARRGAGDGVPDPTSGHGEDVQRSSLVDDVHEDTVPVEGGEDLLQVHA